MPQRSQLPLTVLLYAVLVALVFAHQVNGKGALASPASLLAELHGTADAEQPWQLGEKLPYRYRPLFRAAVLGVYDHLPHSPESFYRLFVAASALSLLAACLALHALLRGLELDRRETTAGVVLFLLGFPVLFSHDMPIHTREDLLGYAWIALTLLAVVKERPWWQVALLGVVGASIRETCLLGILPVWLVSKDERWQRAATYAIPGAAWLALRFARNPGGQGYDYVSVSTAPTLEFPLEALLYLFACFGVLWVAAGLRLAERNEPRHPLLAPRVVLLAFLATAATGWTMGMIREARITYILFPFVIPLALELFRSPRARAILRARPGWLAAGLVLALGLLGLVYLGQDPVARVGVVVPLPDGGQTIQPADSLRTWIGGSFHPGVAPTLDVPGVGRVELAHASWLNGPHVLLHLAASAWLLVGAWVTREQKH